MSNGSSLLTLRAFQHTLRISVPTVFDALTGRLTAERCDARLRDWGETLVAITGTHLDVSGRENIPREACVVMSNHQSISDIPILYAAIPPSLRLRMVTKAELFRVPVWGRAMRLAGFIPINRGNRQSAISSLEIAKRDMAAGTFIWIAPEGTRSRDGAILPLKKGGFILARDTGCPILPVVLDGSRLVVPPDVPRTCHGQRVRVSFGKPIATAGRSIEEVMAEVRLAIDPARREARAATVLAGAGG
ncbi:MAG: 1-acyl-sn-glycerol-3-phosphate acyltransferase [Myxococcales bacterium]|nr:1-acyl-sn-glycerol-3-phosphate acyltransferase [Myxococcales bacterium]